MAAQSSIDLAQQMFVAYYGRPADPAGLAYWANIFDSTNDLTQVLGAFGNSEEFTNNFASLSNSELITNLYQQLYGRDPEAGGLDFYTDRLTSGEATLASIAKQIADGSQNADLTTLNNRIFVANTFTDKIEVLNAIYDASNIPDAQAILATVDDTANSLITGINSVTSYVNSLPISEPDSLTLENLVGYYGFQSADIQYDSGAFIRLTENEVSGYMIIESDGDMHQHLNVLGNTIDVYGEILSVTNDNLILYDNFLNTTSVLYIEFDEPYLSTEIHVEDFGGFTETDYWLML